MSTAPIVGIFSYWSHKILPFSTFLNESTQSKRWWKYRMSKNVKSLAMQSNNWIRIIGLIRLITFIKLNSELKKLKTLKTRCGWWSSNNLTHEQYEEYGWNGWNGWNVMSNQIREIRVIVTQSAPNIIFPAGKMGKIAVIRLKWLNLKGLKWTKQLLAINLLRFKLKDELLNLLNS